MYTLILADDEEQIRSSIISLIDFESVGFKLVGQASNGYEVLELTEKLKPDLVLSDIKMPYMTGIEMAAELREVSPSAFVVFLPVTTTSSTSARLLSTMFWDIC
ncbi:MAG: response regulator [Christensenellales bacterium]